MSRGAIVMNETTNQISTQTNTNLSNERFCTNTNTNKVAIPTFKKIKILSHLDSSNLKFQILEQHLPLEVSRIIFSEMSKKDRIHFNEKVPNHLRIIKKFEFTPEDKKNQVKLMFFKWWYYSFYDIIDNFIKFDLICLESFLEFARNNKHFLRDDPECKWLVYDKFDDLFYAFSLFNNSVETINISQDQIDYYYNLIWSMSQFFDISDLAGDLYDERERDSRQRD